MIDGVGTSAGACYEFSVAGAVEGATIDSDVITASYRDASIDPDDEIDGRSVTGSVDDELDAYWFDGDIGTSDSAATRLSTSSTTPGVNNQYGASRPVWPSFTRFRTTDR
ncbi:hypothetical protein HYG81_03660 [Natrinema zhouii]|uniref:Uncharacterized protein n=1 Tax=Natrinema zhouii TaxID=1710539 RepID=A0A7D6GWU8_9EURY|nr:hypothetical protein [Natrinema zhouii]QLK26726.1 hypothetical protein HYG81_03660 [Natrinema zhouii]